MIKARNNKGHAATLCADEGNTNGCEGSGWTFVGYANGDRLSVSSKLIQLKQAKQARSSIIASNNYH